MSATALAERREQLPANVLEALVQGDISKLDTAGRVTFYNLLCTRQGLDPTTQPFGYLWLNGKLVLYALKACAEQLRKRDHISIKIMAREYVNEVYTVTANATRPDGRCDESIGAVAIGGLKGDALANAIMKAETKSKRRVTLSICALGMLDETEVDTIEGARILAKSLVESDAFVPPVEHDETETLQADAPPQDAPETNGAAAAADEETEDEERQRVQRHMWALIAEYKAVGGQRGTELYEKMHNDETRHAFLQEFFGVHGLRQMPPDDLHRFISMIETRISECTSERNNNGRQT